MNRLLLGTKSNPRSNLALLGCLILALAVRVWSLDFGLPHRYHVDEPAYVLAALRLGQGELEIAYPHGSPSLHQVLLLVLFGLLFLFSLLTGQASSPADMAEWYQADPTVFYLMGRGLSVIASLATIAVLWHLVRRLRAKTERPERRALIACLFLSLCFIDVRHAHFVEPYSLVALLVLGTVAFCLEYTRTGRAWIFMCGGLACGMAIGSRYSMLPLGLVPFLAAFLNWRTRKDRRALARDLGRLAATVVVGFVIGRPATVLNSKLFFQKLSTHLLLAVGSTGFEGFRFTDLPSWRFYACIIGIAFGVPLGLMIALGVGLAIGHRRRDDGLVLSFPVAYAAVLVWAPAESSAFARFLVPILPFMALLAADACVALIVWLTPGRSLGTKDLVLACCVLVLVVLPGARIIRLNQLWGRTDTRTLAKQWIEANLPPGAQIAEQWHGPPLATEVDPEPNSLRTYDVEILNPFSADPHLYSMDYYRDQGFDYFVASSFIYELARIDPVENTARQAFYSSLDGSAELVAEFEAFVEQRQPSFFFEEMWGPVVSLWERERPGPTVRVYRVRGER